MNQHTLSKCYEIVCPIHKPICQTESGKLYNQPMSHDVSQYLHSPLSISTTTDTVTKGAGTSTVIQTISTQNYNAVPTRYGAGMYNYMQSQEGVCGGFNNSIVRLGRYDSTTDTWENL